MQDTVKNNYIVTGGPKGLPWLGMLPEVKRDPLGTLIQNALRYGDVIPFTIAGRKTLQINHPDLIKYVLMENHKNYYKSDIYIRFESVLGQGLLTSNGEKWRRDRQKIQPMFKREQVEGYYFDVINHVGEKYKERWLDLTKKGPAELNITHEMASITIEVILKSIFGKNNLDDATINSIHHSFIIFIDYLKDLRLLPKVDMHKLFHTPFYARFNKELVQLKAILNGLLKKYQQGLAQDKYNMFALLFEAQKQDPEHFSEQDIMDHAVSMVFAGFESTSIFLQWLWYALDTRPDIAKNLRSEIASTASCTATNDSRSLAYDTIEKMPYLDLVFKEALRLYPPFWVSSRQPVEEDDIGGFKVKRGTLIVLPQIVMHRHPRWWDDPNAFIPERFLPEKEADIAEGLFFPFSHGPRKCSGYKFVEIEAKTIFAKLLPLFKVTTLNMLGNDFAPGISLKPKHPIQARIERI